VRNLLTILVALAFIWLSVMGSSAQNRTDSFDTWSRLTLGSSGVLNPEALPELQESGRNDVPRHMAFTGTPCLTVLGIARRQTIDPNLYDDVIEVANNCPQRIALQVCYYQSADCIPMEVPGNESREAILGILPSAADFRFEFREKY
jgi:hypothetical protein